MAKDIRSKIMPGRQMASGDGAAMLGLGVDSDVQAPQPIDPNGKLRQMNLELRKKVRRLKPGTNIAAAIGFHGLRLLPVIVRWRETFVDQDGDTDYKPKQAFDCNSMQFTTRRQTVDVDNKATMRTQKVTMKINANTIRAAEETGVANEDIMAAILTDPNWCKSFYVAEYSSDEADREREAEFDEDRNEILDRRKEMAAAVADGNINEAQELALA